MEETSSTIYLVIGIILIVGLTGILFLAGFFKPGHPMPLPYSPQSSPTTFSVIQPAANAVVDGRIDVKGTTDTLAHDLQISIHDQNHIIGEGTFHISETDKGEWIKTISLARSPTTATGEVIISPDEIHIPVTFAVSRLENRLELAAPLPNQVMSGSSVVFKGRMKNFFEGVLHVRLLDDHGTVLFKDTIQAKGDNYQTFSEFEKEIKYGTIVSTTLANGSWELYDVSPKDGAEIVLLTVSIRFKE